MLTIKLRFFALILATVTICSSLLIQGTPCFGAEPRVTAGSAILYERDSKEILFEENSRERRPPASTTKIMTAIIAIEMGSMSDQVVVSKYAASIGGTSIHLREGEIFTFEDLLWGTLLNSGNDAAVALAESVAGTEALFVDLMNQKAFLLGAFDTTFKNTNGLPETGHLSTSYDLAMIADYGLDNPVFAQIVSTKNAVIPKKDTTWKRSLNNTNRLLSAYPGANGIKTGTTNAAGQCLIGSASRESRQLISVVLRSGNRYGDSTKLLNHGFEDYFIFKIPKGSVIGTMYFPKGKPYQVDLETAEEACFAVSGDMLQEYEKQLYVNKPSLPLKGGQKVGYLEIKANKQYKIPVTVVQPVNKETVADSMHKLFYSINQDF